MKKAIITIGLALSLMTAAVAMTTAPAGAAVVESQTVPNTNCFVTIEGGNNPFGYAYAKVRIFASPGQCSLTFCLEYATGFLQGSKYCYGSGSDHPIGWELTIYSPVQASYYNIRTCYGDYNPGATWPHSAHSFRHGGVVSPGQGVPCTPWIYNW